jgi:hypothetical protein
LAIRENESLRDIETSLLNISKQIACKEFLHHAVFYVHYASKTDVTGGTGTTTLPSHAWSEKYSQALQSSRFSSTVKHWGEAQMKISSVIRLRIS